MGVPLAKQMPINQLSVFWVTSRAVVTHPLRQNFPNPEWCPSFHLVTWTLAGLPNVWLWKIQHSGCPGLGGITEFFYTILYLKLCRRTFAAAPFTIWFKFSSFLSPSSIKIKYNTFENTTVVEGQLGITWSTLQADPYTATFSMLHQRTLNKEPGKKKEYKSLI